MTSTPTWTRRIAASDGAWRWVYSGPSTGHGPRASAGSRRTPMAFVSQQIASPRQRHPLGRLEFVDVREADARIASRGYEISAQDLEIVAEIAALPFAEKYAWFREQTAALLKPWTDGFVKMRVRRENALVDSTEQLLGVQFQHIHLRLKIVFEDDNDREVTPSEWLACVAGKLFTEEIGLFTRVQGGDGVVPSWTINPNSGAATHDHLLYLRGVGRLLGRALLEGLSLGSARLARPLLKHLLGTPITLEDVEQLDPELYKSLQWIEDHNGVEALGLDFSVTTRGADGAGDVIELKPHGRRTRVTDENKHEFVAQRMQYALLGAFTEQLQHVMSGVFEVIPQELILPFTVEELERVLYEAPWLDEHKVCELGQEKAREAVKGDKHRPTKP